MDVLINQIQKVIEPVLNEAGVKLIDIQLKGHRGNQLLRVFIDCEDGVTIDKCTDVSRQVSDELDISNLIQNKYRLEVSSPGITRPLTKSEDFRRNLNRNVEIVFEEASVKRTIQGKIVDVTEEVVDVQSKNESKQIAISTIKSGRLSLPW